MLFKRFGIYSVSDIKRTHKIILRNDLTCIARRKKDMKYCVFIQSKTHNPNYFNILASHENEIIISLDDYILSFDSFAECKSMFNTYILQNL